MTHICIIKLTIIGSDNGLLPGQCQAIIWTNARLLLVWPLGTNFSEISIDIKAFSFKKIHFKMSSGKWWAFCLDLNVLKSQVSCTGCWLLLLGIKWLTHCKYVTLMCLQLHNFIWSFKGLFQYHFYPKYSWHDMSVWNFGIMERIFISGFVLVYLYILPVIFSLFLLRLSLFSVLSTL